MERNRCLGCMRQLEQGIACPDCGYDPQAGAGTSSMFLTPGTVLHDTYLVGTPLGHGGFGITYLGWDLNLNVKVAIKEYLPGMLASRSVESNEVEPYTGQQTIRFATGLERFLDEARTLAQFENHPSIVTIRDYFQENRTAYFVMQFVEGMTLKHYLRQKGPLSLHLALNLMMPVLDALREVHAKGVLHRDISPSNIYITRDGQVKLIDFGAARYAMRDDSKSLSVILKPGYAPVEQYSSKGRQGPWTDIYAASATLYRMLTGRRLPDSLDRLAQDELMPPSHLGLSLPPGFESVLLKGLAIEHGQRFQSMDLFQQSLLSFAVPDAGSGETGAFQPPAHEASSNDFENPTQDHPGRPTATHARQEHEATTQPAVSAGTLFIWVLFIAGVATTMLLLLYLAVDLLMDSLG